MIETTRTIIQYKTHLNQDNEDPDGMIGYTTQPMASIPPFSISGYRNCFNNLYKYW